MSLKMRTKAFKLVKAPTKSRLLLYDKGENYELFNVLIFYNIELRMSSAK